MQNRVRMLLGIVFSVVAAIAIVANVDWQTLREEFTTANYWWFIPSCLALIVSLWVRGMRWRQLLDRIPTPTRMFYVTNIGYFVNNVIPLRAGELARIYLASREEGITVMRSLSTALVERLMDILVVFAFALVALPFVEGDNWLLAGGRSLAAIAVVGICGLFVLAAVHHIVMPIVNRFTERLPRFVQAIVKQLDHFLVSIRDVGMQGWIKAFLWTFLIWTLSGLSMYTMLFCFLPEASWVMGLIVMASVALGGSVPSAPAGVGLYEASAIAGLALFGVDTEIGLAYGILNHLMNFVVINIFGLIGLNREEQTLNSLTASASAFMRNFRNRGQAAQA